jgi:hypothetical protein
LEDAAGSNAAARWVKCNLPLAALQAAAGSNTIHRWELGWPGLVVLDHVRAYGEEQNFFIPTRRKQHEHLRSYH